jgi:nitrogen fixation protein FixH
MTTNNLKILAPRGSNSARWNPWPVCIIAFFTLAITGCVGFVIFCSLHPSELVADDYYEQELRYQSQLDRMERVRALGSLASIQYNSDHKLITISIPESGGEARPTGKVELYRPSAANLDQSVKLEVDGQGNQQIDAGNLQPGLWKVKVTWSAGGKDYFLDRKVRI